MLPNQTYFYRVSASNTVGSSLPVYPSTTVSSNWTAPISVDIGPPPVAPPSSLIATYVEPRSVNLIWSYTQSANRATSFQIQRSVNGGAFAQLAIVPVADRNYMDATVAFGRTYAYRMIAFNATTQSNPSNTDTVSTPALAAPSNLRVSNRTANAVTIAWNDNSRPALPPNETGFAIERMRNGANDWLRTAQVVANVRSYQNTGLPRRTTYDYRVCGVVGPAAAPTGYSLYSNVVSGTTR